MTEGPLAVQSAEFSRHVVLTCRWMRERGVEYSLTNQFMRCGTSIGANIYEAQHAHSTRDFISKLEIALKETNECVYWIDLLFKTDSINKAAFDKLSEECASIKKMLVASINTIKNKPRS